MSLSDRAMPSLNTVCKVYGTALYRTEVPRCWHVTKILLCCMPSTPRATPFTIGNWEEQYILTNTTQGKGENRFLLVSDLRNWEVEIISWLVLTLAFCQRKWESVLVGSQKNLKGTYKIKIKFNYFSKSSILCFHRGLLIYYYPADLIWWDVLFKEAVASVLDGLKEV